MQEHREDIDLPFKEESFDLAIWCYDHRYGLCVVIIFYLLIAIAFVSARIVIETNRSNSDLMVELPTLVELKEQRDQLEKMVEQLQEQQEIDWEQIRNEVSNEEMSDEQMRELIESGEAVDQFDTFTDDLSVEEYLANLHNQSIEMSRNQSAYRERLEDLERTIAELRQNQGSEKPQERRDANHGGGVTASYSFTHPVRHAQKFTIPAYKCMGGGEVRIAVFISRSGEVISAEHLVGGDECMQRYAIEAALSSRFDSNNSAPNPHRGTITYFYVPQ